MILIYQTSQCILDDSSEHSSQVPVLFICSVWNLLALFS